MDDNKLFAKNEKDLENLVEAVRIYRQDIGMETGIEKWDEANDKWGKEWNYQIKKKSEHLLKRKLTNT